MAAAEVSTHDVVVVGARCAGAATARLLAARGYDVAVLDRAAMPSDTLSTHGIARGGVVQLSRWGLLDDVLASGAPPIRDITFSTAGEQITRPVKDKAGVDLLVAPRRWRLDEILLDAARRDGVVVHDSTSVTSLLRDEDGRVGGVRARTNDGRDRAFVAKHVVGADGLRSTTAGLVGARQSSGFETDVALFYFYVDQVAWNGFEFHVAPGGFAGVFPTHDGQACVWLSRPAALLDGVRRAGAQRTEALTAALTDVAPSLGARVRAGRVAEKVRGTLAPPNYVRQAHGQGWSLVGDAGYHRDPITGHGITDAFRDAELLADSLHEMLTGSQPEAIALSDYERARNRALRETFELTRRLSRFPDPARFVELQIELSGALDREAQSLASRPVPAGLHAVFAA